MAEERRGLPFPISTAVNIINPFPDIAAQFTGAVGIYTFGRMARGYGAGIFPSIFTSMAPTQFGLGGKTKGFGLFARKWLKGFEWGGGPEMMRAMKLGGEYKTPFMKALRGVLRESKWKTYIPEDFLASLGGALGKVGVPVTSLTGKGVAASIGKMGRYAVIGSSIGNVALPIIAGISAGQLVSNIVGLTFKAGVAAMNTISRVSEHIRGLEFGGELGPGYITGAAKTERQRAIQQIQRSHLNARRNIGNEAELYSGIT